MGYYSLETLNKEQLIAMIRILGVLFAGTTLLYVANIIYRRKLEWVLKESKIELEKNVKFLKTLLNAIPTPVFYKDTKGKYIECNSNYEEFMGKKKDEVINKTIFEIEQEEYEDVHDTYDKHILSKGGNVVYESKVKYVDGSYKDVILSKAALVTSDNNNDKVEGLVCIMMDISERKKIEKKINRLLKIKEDMLFISQSIINIRDVEELFNLILEKAIGSIKNAEYGSVMILENSKLLKVAAHKGYNNDKIKNVEIPLEKSFLWISTKGNIHESIIIQDIYNIIEETSNELREENKELNIHSSISTPLIINNRFYGILNVDSTMKEAFNLEDLELMEYIKSQVEISITNHNLYEKIIYLSRYDKLTNIYNRRYFENIFFSKIRDVDEFNIVIFDLNSLKMVNDTYGHLAGDKYIVKFVEKIKNELSDNEILARYGGDEFIGIYFRKQDELDAIFHRFIREFKENPLVFDGKEVTCSFSFGMSNFSRDSQNYEELIRIADDRMYRLKGIMKKEENT